LMGSRLLAVDSRPAAADAHSAASDSRLHVSHCIGAIIRGAAQLHRGSNEASDAGE
jgi:hypothetical protein